MGGLAALFFIALYISVAYWVFKRFGGSNFRWLVLVLAVLILCGDAVVGRLYLKHLCAKEGGLKVYRVVEHVDGFMSNTSWDGDYWLKNGGFQFSESPPVNGLVMRYSIQGGKLITEKRVPAKSKYRLRSVHIGGSKDVYLRYEYVIDDTRTGEMLGTHTEIGFNGGWVERVLAYFSSAGGGAVAWCTPIPWTGNPTKDLVNNTLKP
jgi:hypothetical protein